MRAHVLLRMLPGLLQIANRGPVQAGRSEVPTVRLHEQAYAKGTTNDN